MSGFACLALCFLLCAVAADQLDSIQSQLRQHNEEAQQIRQHLNNLVQDISTIVAYFEMQDPANIASLTRQVAQLQTEERDREINLRQQLQEMNLKMQHMEQKLTDTLQNCSACCRSSSMCPLSPTPEPTNADRVCGDLLNIPPEGTTYTGGATVLAGWTMCYIDGTDAANTNYETTHCRNLIINISKDGQSYTDSQALKRAGGEFGCWRSIAGVMAMSVAACTAMYNQAARIHFPPFPRAKAVAVCIKYPE